MRLALFFTRHTSLQTWAEAGMLEREIAIYQKLQALGIQVSFVTYGDRHDLQFSDQLPGIQILCNRWHLPPKLYAFLLPWLHGNKLKANDIFKSNQTFGADVALRAAQRWGKPLIARGGYLWSEFVERQFGTNSRVYRKALKLESYVFIRAQQLVVTTPAIASSIRQRLPETSSKTTVIPNYVETDWFQPQPETTKQFDLVFVGRLVPQKNVETLLEAIAPLSVSILIIGDGFLRNTLQMNYGHLGNRVHWQGRVSSRELPKYLHQARLFVLPSHYEGHPKALIEAMACGLPVLGTAVPGIREVLVHGKTGWLCHPDVVSLRQSIQSLLSQQELCHKLGQQARKTALQKYGLDRVIQAELAVLNACVSV